MLAISIRQPWAWLVVQGIKDIENREWQTSVREDILVHASKWQPDELFIRDIEERHGVVVDRKALEFGGVIGSVRVVECYEQHPSKWFLGPVGWELADAKALPFRAVRGMPGLFRA